MQPARLGCRGPVASGIETRRPPFERCPGTGHTAAFFGMSEEPRGEGIWKKLDGIRDGFRCQR